MTARRRGGPQQQGAPRRHGTGTDPLNPGMAFQAVQVLDLPEDCSVLLGAYLDSPKMGKKDILKVADVEITDADVERLALFGPNANVSWIRDYKVHRKTSMRLPDQVKGILTCPNPNCITTHEDVTTRFDVIRKEPITLRCGYCERRLHADEVEFA